MQAYLKKVLYGLSSILILSQTLQADITEIALELTPPESPFQVLALEKALNKIEHIESVQVTLAKQTIILTPKAGKAPKFKDITSTLEKYDQNVKNIYIAATGRFLSKNKNLVFESKKDKTQFLLFSPDIMKQSSIPENNDFINKETKKQIAQVQRKVNRAMIKGTLHLNLEKHPAVGVYSVSSI